MQLSVDELVHVGEDVVFRDIDGEVVLLDVGRGTYFGLDPLGTRVWQGLVDHGCARPILASLLEEFEVTADALEADVTRLLNELSANSLIRRRS